MSNYQQYTEELNELNKQFKQQNPSDILQFCFNHFSKRLSDQRSVQWDLKDKAQLNGFNLFPTLNDLKELKADDKSSIPLFKTPFADNDPHTIHQSHDEPPSSSSETDNKKSTSSSLNMSNQPPQSNVFKSDYGNLSSSSPSSTNNTSSPFKSAFLAPNDPNTASASQANKLSSRSGFAAGISKPSPMNFNANRRTSVSAEALNPDTFGDDDWTPPVHEFTNDQLERLNASVVKNFLFSQLDEDSLRTIIFALEEKTFKKGDEIIKQGDEGDFFYVVEKGIVDFYVNGQKVNTSGPGSSFGELALMYNSPRAATALAETDCILWALDRMTFRRILLEGTSKKRSMYESFLKEVPVLKSLSSYELSKLADALNTEVYQIGENVVNEGEAGENFYFIESGTAKVIKEGDGVIKTLNKGDYFGELALLHDSPRQATVKATSYLKVVTLGKSGFQRLLGPAVDVLKTQDPTKH